MGESYAYVMIFLNWIYLLYGLAIIILVIGYFMIQSFLSRTSSINSPDDLNRFKSLARINMYLAIGQLVIGIPAILLMIYGGFTGRIGLLLIIGLNGVLFAAGKVVKNFEDKTRNLPVTDQTLESEYKATGNAWVSNTFPNF
jgi:hypothetical protein